MRSIKQRHLDAYRERAGMVGELLSCICCYPLERSDTTTAHDIHCPAHAMIIYHREQRAKALQSEPPWPKTRTIRRRNRRASLPNRIRR